MDWSDVETEILSISGHLQPGQERWLYDTARALPDWAVILEIGPFKGRSTCSLAAGCAGSRKHIYTIDHFHSLWSNTDDASGESFFAEFWATLERLKLDPWVTPLPGFSHEFYQTWQRPIHMLWIDGGHADEVVRADYEAFWPHLAAGGLLALHDVSHGEYGGINGPDRVWYDIALPLLTDVDHCGSLAYGRKLA